MAKSTESASQEDIVITDERRIELWKEVYSALLDPIAFNELMDSIFEEAEIQGASATYILDEFNKLYNEANDIFNAKLQPKPQDNENDRSAKVSAYHKIFEAYTGVNPITPVRKAYTLGDWERYYKDFDQNAENARTQDPIPVSPKHHDALRNSKKIFKQIVERKNKTKQNIKMLQDAVGKLTRALPVRKGKYDPDCVPVNAGEEEIYLSEVIRAQQINQITGTKYDFIPMSDADRLLHQVQYKDGKLVKSVDGKIASTMGMSSKYKKNFQSFVLGKGGELYLFNSDQAEQRADGQWLVSTHGAVMDERPAEMAGIMTINDEGKVTYIQNHSGHYRPDEYDMWRGIKVLTEKGVLSDDCKVNVKGKESSVKEFMGEMAKPGLSGKPLHEELKQNRYVKHVRYAIKHQGADAAAALKEAGVDKDYRDFNGETGLHWVFAKIGENKVLAYLKRDELNRRLEREQSEDRQKEITRDIKRFQVKSAEADKVLVKAVRDLVAAGYDPNAKDKKGKTLADYAKMHDQTAGLEELERAKAKIEEKNRIIKEKIKLAEKGYKAFFIKQANGFMNPDVPDSIMNKREEEWKKMGFDTVELRKSTLQELIKEGLHEIRDNPNGFRRPEINRRLEYYNQLLKDEKNNPKYAKAEKDAKIPPAPLATVAKLKSALNDAPAQPDNGLAASMRQRFEKPDPDQPNVAVYGNPASAQRGDKGGGSPMR